MPESHTIARVPSGQAKLLSGSVVAARQKRCSAEGSPHMHEIERWRDRLNTAILVLPGQWFTLMAIYWLRFYPPLRPFQFDVPFPSAAAFLFGCAASCVPFLLPRAYFTPFAFERGRFYRRLGLRWFRYVAPDGDLVKRILRRIEPSYRVVRDRVSLRKHIEGTFANERWHLAFFIAGTLTFCHAAYTRQYVLGSLILVTNVAFNLFPVFHQRFKRARIRLRKSVSPDKGLCAGPDTEPRAASDRRGATDFPEP